MATSLPVATSTAVYTVPDALESKQDGQFQCVVQTYPAPPPSPLAYLLHLSVFLRGISNADDLFCCHGNTTMP